MVVFRRRESKWHILLDWFWVMHPLKSHCFQNLTYHMDPQPVKTRQCNLTYYTIILFLFRLNTHEKGGCSGRCSCHGRFMGRCVPSFAYSNPRMFFVCRVTDESCRKENLPKVSSLQELAGTDRAKRSGTLAPFRSPIYIYP